MLIIVIRMDMPKVKKNADPKTLARLRGVKTVVGAKQLKKALANGTAGCVFLAENADPALTEPIAALCCSYHVDFVWVPSMTDLGHACGIDVGAAAAATII